MYNFHLSPVGLCRKTLHLLLDGVHDCVWLSLAVSVPICPCLSMSLPVTVSGCSCLWISQSLAVPVPWYPCPWISLSLDNPVPVCPSLLLSQTVLAKEACQDSYGESGSCQVSKSHVLLSSSLMSGLSEAAPISVTTDNKDTWCPEDAKVNGWILNGFMEEEDVWGDGWFKKKKKYWQAFHFC